MSRRLQFSLRGLLVVLTFACLCLGRKVERAQRRGQAIDAVIRMGCAVGYLENSEVQLSLTGHEMANHFLCDLQNIPVVVSLNENDVWSREYLKPAIASQLSRINGINVIWLPEVHIDCSSENRIPVISAVRRRSIELMLPDSTIEEPRVYHYTRPKRGHTSASDTKE